MTLLEKARAGRIAALESLASCKVDNIFADDAPRARDRRQQPTLTFATVRSAPANVTSIANMPAAPELRHAA
ncbi:hypothetical protein P1J78_01225 [Psychromarinibacter sp. C21-152]|uniref:Uncharacterized protein n=1 Tax=Psychromarinibacter sediminicola TaxID=3033385 RepID=A0AAE3NRS8_9RHOB|nr:hypothetical protein [Psychromarinibacter sediminicola]MDF0599342.1 hypothetical protein [Psychromarinibacter sediminicola]